MVCTPEEFAELTHPGGSPVRRQVDFRNDLLPLLFAEMQARYYTHAAYLKGGVDESAAARDHLRAGLGRGRLRRRRRPSSSRSTAASTPPATSSPAPDASYTSSRDYQSQVYDMIESDLDEALADGGSPVKAAQEVLRILRDQLRSVIEFGGLSLESYIDFQSNVRGRINRLEAGPPPLRSQQLLGSPRRRRGPGPLRPAPRGHAAGRRSGDPPLHPARRRPRRSRSTASCAATSTSRRWPGPSSPLLSRLYAKGRLTQLSYGDTAVGSVAISEDFHPYDAEGRLQPNLSLLGVLTEGRALLHPLPAVTAQPAAGGARRPGTAWRRSSAESGDRPVRRRQRLTSGGGQGQRLVDVVDEIVHVLEPDRQADGLGPDAGGDAARRRASWRWVVDAGWMASDLASPRLRSRLNSCSESKKASPAS